jgi:hypothetical protein
MRTRFTGLLLALLFVVLAAPAGLDHCQDSPPQGWPQAQAAAVAGIPTASAARADPRSAAFTAAALEFRAEDAAAASAVHECADCPAPPQNPYIETSNGSGRTAAVSRASFAANHIAATSSIVTTSAVRQHDVAADDTGPPLWLSTCVSRT